MAIREELRLLADRMNAKPEPIASLYAVYQFNIGDAAPIQVAFDNAKVKVLDEATESADCTLTLSEKNFRKLLADDLNATMAFMTGSLKIDGKLGLALKLQEVLKQY
ncbi:SCP2 sterol-binding domain-containing protein [Paenibacillus sp. FSL M7-1455]|jgi:putative sterol carrier protein|uniref:SCP2 sterol-binding domain-containing protein n=1 Tax=Paenibacillus sp. FSL M7-1455 TaxID=2975316 RepID=UPI0030F64F26